MRRLTVLPPTRVLNDVARSTYKSFSRDGLKYKMHVQSDYMKEGCASWSRTSDSRPDVPRHPSADELARSRRSPVAKGPTLTSTDSKLILGTCWTEYIPRPEGGTASSIPQLVFHQMMKQGK